MSDMPEKIWAWEYMASRQDDVMQGGWTRHEESREIEYVRTDRLERIALAANELARELDTLHDAELSGRLRRALAAFREATE